MPETGIHIPVLPAHIPRKAGRLRRSGIQTLPPILPAALYLMPSPECHSGHGIPGRHTLNPHGNAPSLHHKTYPSVRHSSVRIPSWP